jgi:hypothetical protein
VAKPNCALDDCVKPLLTSSEGGLPSQPSLGPRSHHRAGCELSTEVLDDQPGSLVVCERPG